VRDGSPQSLICATATVKHRPAPIALGWE